MPPSPKTQKRAAGGPPKAKGAVRAKSGCYTCRIRRKKCDEQSNVDGFCQTCVRLKLQCLGFGAKRPEWLRENRNVVELRDKIKCFLASQGMIKGHSGAPSRTTEHEPVMLRLSDDGNSSTDSSPSPPSFTLTMDEESRPLQTLSAVRDSCWHPTTYHSLPTLSPELSPDDSSPFDPVDGGLAPDDMISYSSPSLSSSPSAWPSISHLQPALKSSLSPSYNQSFLDEEDDFSMFVPSVNYGYMNYGYYPQVDALVEYYRSNVFKLQYLLADHHLFSCVVQGSTQVRDVAYEAVCLVSSVHQYKVQNHGDRSDINRRYEKLLPILKPRRYTIPDAMAALHVISSLLFTGGKGDWSHWLNVAYVFADSILRAPKIPGRPAKILRECDDGLRYVIKTAMWFDVLASACLSKSPHFLWEYRDLFSPPEAYIDDRPAVLEPKLSMLSIMGCENRVVWALAEVTELFAWKQNEMRLGRLSVPMLVERGKVIEKHIRSQMGPSLPRHDDLVYQRYVTSHVFCASARVYLHSVLSGDYPSCPDIVKAIDETIGCLDQVSDMGHDGTSQLVASRSVVRSVVFSIFLCGCLTDEPAKRRKLRQYLEAQEAEAVGNCREVRLLMEKVWDDRDKNGLNNLDDQPVRWREFLKDSTILLV